MSNRVGIVTVADSRKGLWRDMEVLSWAISMPSPRAEGDRAQGLSVFCAKMSDRVSPSVMNSLPEGGSAGAPLFQGTFDAFSQTCDVVVFFETFYINLVKHLIKTGKRAVYVPNLDWATCSDGGSMAWKRQIKELQNSTDKFQVWARQPTIEHALLEHGVRSEHVPWSVPDEIVQEAKVRPDEGRIKFFVNAGFGGYKGRRAVDLVLKAFAKAKKRAPMELIVKSIKPLVEYVGDAMGCIDEDVGVIEGFSPRTQIDQLMKEADVVVSVSRWEGFGYGVIEALHAGKPVITHGGWPVGDMVTHKHNGLLVECSSQGKFNLTPHWEADVDSIADAMVELATDRKLLRRLSAPCPAELQARQYAFMLRARALLFEEPEPRVVIFGSEQNLAQPSERYWQMALEAHGYRVDYQLAKGGNYGTALAKWSDFVLVGKARLETLKKVRDNNAHDVPVIIWHHDYGTVVSELHDNFLKYGDMVFAPYEQDDVNYLLPGPRSGGDRGRGLRRTYKPRSEPEHDVVFIGGDSFERKGLLKQLKSEVGLVTFGPGMAHPPVYDEAADDVYSNAKIALSLSRFNDTPGYTSNRLFHAAALGTSVFSHTFPGDRSLFPEKLAGIFFVRGGDMAASIKNALIGWEHLKDQAQDVEDYCWRFHSWHNRVYEMLWKINRRTADIRDKRRKRNRKKKPPRNALQFIPKGKPMAPPKPPVVQTPEWNGPKKVNIGSGPRVHAGYENIDVRPFPGVRQVDLMKGLPYPDNVLHEVLAEDVLEHFRPDDLRNKILPEIYRVLRPSGRLVAQMPDLHEMVKQWKRGDVDDEMMSMRIHGRQDYPENTHYASYTEASMTKILNRIGFGTVKRTDTRNWNMVLEARKGPAEAPQKNHRKEFKPQPGRGDQTDWGAYWEQRSQKMGQLSVTPGSWNELRQKQETDKLFKLMEVPWRKRSGAIVLDYGCGVGRMSRKLQEAEVKVKGVDVSPNMVMIARKNGVDADALDGKRIPYEDDTFEGLFVCTVLQHIPDLDLKATVDEIKRVLKPGAFIMLFENCSSKFGRTSSSGHVIFREPGEYASLFDGIKEYLRYTIEGEEHVLMWGELAAEPEAGDEEVD